MDSKINEEYVRQAEHLADTVKKAIDNLDNFSFPDQMRFMLAYMEFANVADDILSKYDGRNIRMKELLNELNKLNVSETDDEDD